MARRLRILSAGVDRPDERSTRPEDKVGPSVAVSVLSEDLRAQPVHTVRISEDEALRLIEQLATAVNIMRRERAR